MALSRALFAFSVLERIPCLPDQVYFPACMFFVAGPNFCRKPLPNFTPSRESPLVASRRGKQRRLSVDKVYSNKSISNIVESSHYTEIHNWCREEGQPCKWSFWSRPYHCIVGEYESEPLLVPDGCQFAHVDDRNLCANFSSWNATAIQNCANRNGQRVLSFSMLESCGLDRFSGVQFVCCPAKDEKSTTTTTMANARRLQNISAKLQNEALAVEYDASDNESDEDDGDDEDDGQYDRIDASQVTKSTAAPKSPVATLTKAFVTKDVVMTDDDDDDDEDDEDDDFEEKDPYFRIADPKREHELYHAALQRLEQRHRPKVNKEIKEWSEAQLRYKEVKEKDPKYAEKLNKQISKSFENTVAALEEEYRDERLQIEEVHQQRVMAEMNEKKRAALKLFRASLVSSKPNRKNLLHAMKALFRIEEKNRTHLLNHFKHLLRTDPEAASAFKSSLQKGLRDIDLSENRTIAMLRQTPSLESKVRTAIMEFWQIYRQENTPDVSSSYLTSIHDPHSNERLIAFYESQYRSDFGNRNKIKWRNNVDVANVVNQQQRKEQSPPEPPVMVRDPQSVDKKKPSSTGEESAHTSFHYKPLDSFVKKNNLVQEFVSKQYRSHLSIVFLQVDACTPEERHVACMQINGYENPAYKYFEDRS
ncbi:unnamed protein product [Soboliphyme baturini]|uniref:CULLIN_2 domain-containing protein n=1 Tax=Soboliphyme baturini TaxID=241478 RepID=A0A183IND3_9BILA|nr:unnamed protein product [Soboliphyme baturini]